MNRRLQELLTLALALTLAIPIVVEMFDINPNPTWWLAVPLAAFLVVTGIGIWARFSGAISSVKPGFLHEKLFGLSERRFMMDMIYYADSDLQETNKVIAWKGCIARAMLILLAAMVLSVTVILLLSP